MKDLVNDSRDIARELARKYSTMTHDELDVLESILVPMKFAKGQMILNEGEVCKHVYYIERGLIRQFYFKNGKQITEHLGEDRSIFMCIESLFREEPTKLQVEAIEPTWVYALPKQKLEQVALHNVNIQILYRIGIGNIAFRKTGNAVEERKSIAHPSIGFCRYYSQSFGFGFYPLTVRHVSQMLLYSGRWYSFEVEYLTARENSGQDLVLLCGSQYKDHIRRRFFESLQESIEGLLREHVYLVDDIYAVFSYLRRYHHLLYELSYIVDRVV